MIERLLIGTLAFIIAVFGSYLFGVGNGRADEKAVWEVKEAKLLKAEITLRAEHATKVSQLVLAHQKINKEVADDHETALTKVAADLAAARAESRRLGGLRINVPACKGSHTGTDAQATGTSQRNEDTTTTVALPKQVEDGLWSIVGEADEVTEQLRSCQSWIKTNGFYGDTIMK